jgi:hypothetical protein
MFGVFIKIYLKLNRQFKLKFLEIKLRVNIGARPLGSIMKRTIIFFLIFFTSFSFAENEPDSKSNNPFEYFVGSWIGEETGKSGNGKGEREYQFILDNNFLFQKNTSTFQPQEKNPKGEVHQDWAFYSFDRTREKYILREFHSEGFVNQYVLDSLSADNKTMIFISEGIENVPKGWRARVSFMIQNENEFDETFELAAPGKDFTTILKNKWRREK